LLDGGITNSESSSYCRHAPTSGKWDNDRHVEKLRKADGGRGIAEVYSLYASGPCNGVQPFRYRPTYVHAKVAIFDDEWLTIGSANLNDRGLVTDSETL
jgi:Phosphatidylserine/phosphatidylglycerophosphate/cardiolipin synthases and related enzymes